MTAPRPSGPGPGPPSRRAEVLTVLRDAGEPLTIAEIADRLGVHANTVRFHLDTLVDAGQVARVTGTRRAPGRPPQLFRAVPRMDPAGTRQYQLLAQVLAEALAADPDPAARASAAGRAWGERLAKEARGSGRRVRPVERLRRLLADLGFAPEPVRARGSQIQLRNCPFLAVATELPSVACPVHLGMMQGAMDAWDSPVRVAGLDPFVDPDRCVVHLLGSATR